MKYEIDVEGLPEGWKPVAFRLPRPGENYIRVSGKADLEIGLAFYSIQPRLIVEEIKPKRIVLEETEEKNIQYASGIYSSQCLAEIVLHNKPKIWREVKDNKE